MTARSPEDRRAELAELYQRLKCVECPLAATRTQVVFGSGNADADLMLVGEAPGFHEDRQGRPFVGQAGKLLDKLLAEIGMDRDDIFIANVLKCRPPNNRDPKPEEIAECEPHLFRQVELIEPRVIATLGNFSTKLLTGRPEGITKVHGRVQIRQLGERTVQLYPLFHPAAALYTPAMLATLREDFQRLPGVIEEAAGVNAVAAPAPEEASGAGSDAGQAEPRAVGAPAPAPPAEPPRDEGGGDQMGLFE